ncbi:YncE family protein [Sorangium sp. So ce513]|uniref:YncE family protein n=1 Tax=Sorangium sp. So ce513 TaxID=3133315 RepID=UPI003F5F6573
MVKIGLLAVAISIPLLGCNVDPPPPSTGGVEGGGGSEPDTPGACERGVVVVTSDYQSTNIAIAKLDGTTLSPSFVSSGATKPGLSLALSGDVDVPAVAPPSGRVVLIDRYGTNVITWMDLETAEVIAQLPVGQGFESNPHDYIEVDEDRAFVSRFGSNPAPGAEPFDEGGDLLILDTKKYAIEGRIALPEEREGLLPRPSGVTRVGDDVVVSLGRLAADFSDEGEGRFVGVSPAENAVAWTVDIEKLHGCGRVAVSPSGERLAVACSSRFDADAMKFDPATSDIVIYDARSTPPREIKRLGVARKLDAGIQPSLAFASEDILLAKTYGGNASAGDSVFSVNIGTGAVTPLGEASQPFVFGGVHCSPGCGDVCLLSDAERSKLRRWKVTANGALEALEDVTVDTQIGLPPRFIGGL